MDDRQNTPWCSKLTDSAYGRVSGCRAISALRRWSTSLFVPRRNFRWRIIALRFVTIGSTCRAYTSSRSSYSTPSTVSGDPSARFAV
eukprot:31044-Pelagococcus_subviridis.AAC.11